MRTPRLLVLAVSLVGFAACSDSTAPDEETLVLELVSGDEQRAVIGSSLPEPLVVRVTNDDGQPQAGVAVEWRALGGGGAIIVPPSDRPPSDVPVLESTTDENGLSEAVWAMGFGAWEQALEVVAEGVSIKVDVVAEPIEWQDVLDVSPYVEIVDGHLQARLRMVNRWVERVGFRPGCFYEAHLRTWDGEPVPGWMSHSCSGVLSTRFLRAGEPLITSANLWRIPTSELDPGIYTVEFGFFDGLQINDRPHGLPEVTVLVVVE